MIKQYCIQSNCYQNFPDKIFSLQEGLFQLFTCLGNQVAEVVNVTNSSNQSALDVACRYSQDDSVQVLLAAGADPTKEHDGCHPIHTALNVKSDACAATLLEFHPEQVYVRDSKYGGTPLHWAKTKEVISLLSSMYL